jgi:hypothetical protein
MALEDSDDPTVNDLIPKFYIPVDKLGYEQVASIYTVYERVNGSFPTGIE